MPCPPLTIRAVKAAPLTSDELDGNFLTLIDFVNTLEVVVNELLRRLRPTLYYAQSTTAPGTDAYTITISPTPALISDLIGKLILVMPNVSNTDAATLTVNALAATPIVKGSATPLATNDIVIGRIFAAVFDGQNFQLA